MCIQHCNCLPGLSCLSVFHSGFTFTRQPSNSWQADRHNAEINGGILSRQVSQQTQHAQHIHALAACRMVSGKRKASASSSDAALQVRLGGCQVGSGLRGGELVGRHVIGLLGSEQHLTSGQVNEWAARKVLVLHCSCSSSFPDL
jgi:hypothetical protein